MKYKSELISKEKVAEGTTAFHFKKPTGFQFIAGQYIDMTLVAPPETDTEGNTRAFSIASAPYESDITIVTRMRDSSFKRVLSKAEEGLPVEIEGPIGSFFLHEKSSRPAIILVGGIGITPFVSILKDATEKKLPHKIYLFYSNRRPEDVPFLNVLSDLKKKNPNFTFVPTMTQADKSASVWEGETGYINMQMIDKYVKDRTDAVYYMAGPQLMVYAMRNLLNSSGISNDDLRFEEFDGY